MYIYISIYKFNVYTLFPVHVAVLLSCCELNFKATNLNEVYIFYNYNVYFKRVAQYNLLTVSDTAERCQY